MARRPATKERQPRDRSGGDTGYQNPPETLDKVWFYGLKLDDDQKRFRDAIYSPDIKIVFCNARAGTGKTQIAISTANIMVRKYGLYDGITYIVSPCMEGALGFLPGTLEEKTRPYSSSLEQALIVCGEQPEKVIIQNGFASVKEGAYVDFIPDTFLRGSNITDRIVIIDEAQNFSRSGEDIHTLKKVLTRCHDTSKVVVIGHAKQKDWRYSGETAFEKYIKHFQGDPRTAVCTLTKNYRGWIANHADELEPDMYT